MEGSFNISLYSTSESSTNSSKRSTESAILIFFPCFTVCIFARNLESDGLGRVVQPTGKYLSIRHMEYPKFQTGIFGRMESALYIQNMHVILQYLNLPLIQCKPLAYTCKFVRDLRWAFKWRCLYM